MCVQICRHECANSCHDAQMQVVGQLWELVLWTLLRQGLSWWSAVQQTSASRPRASALYSSYLPSPCWDYGFMPPWVPSGSKLGCQACATGWAGFLSVLVTWVCIICENHEGVCLYMHIFSPPDAGIKHKTMCMSGKCFITDYISAPFLHLTIFYSVSLQKKSKLHMKIQAEEFF